MQPKNKQYLRNCWQRGERHVLACLLATFFLGTKTCIDQETVAWPHHSTLKKKIRKSKKQLAHQCQVFKRTTRCIYGGNMVLQSSLTKSDLHISMRLPTHMINVQEAYVNISSPHWGKKWNQQHEAFLFPAAGADSSRWIPLLGAWDCSARFGSLQLYKGSGIPNKHLLQRTN